MNRELHELHPRGLVRRNDECDGAPEYFHLTRSGTDAEPCGYSSYSPE
jgi:hypothetical protein